MKSLPSVLLLVSTLDTQKRPCCGQTLDMVTCPQFAETIFYNCNKGKLQKHIN